MTPMIQPGDTCEPVNMLRLINAPNLAYEHLDWFTSKSRISENSTFCLHSPEELEAMISVAPETQDFAWIRFFFTQRDGNHRTNFHLLLEHARNWLRSQGVTQLFSLATSEWFENLLLAAGFYVQNHLVSLATRQISGSTPEPHPELEIRPMRWGDWPEVWELDQLCFAPPWQLNQDSLKKCYQTSEYASLATFEGKPIAYQVTTRFLDNLHLARLAVLPRFRGRGIAKSLLFDLSVHFEDNRYELISVNTQADNRSSLRVYEALGFKQEGSLVPVYCLDLA